MEFIKDEIVNAIVFGEAFDGSLFVFKDPAREIAGNADIGVPFR